MFDINKIIDYLNENYNQQRKEDVPNIDAYDDETIIAFYDYGAIVLHQELITEIDNVDGHWSDNGTILKSYFMDRINSITLAYKHLKEYLKEHGYPCYSVVHIDEFGEKEYWEKDICDYTLVKPEEQLFQKHTSLPFLDIEIKECDVKIKTNSLRVKTLQGKYMSLKKSISFIALTTYKEKILSNTYNTITWMPCNKSYRITYEGCKLHSVENYNELYSRYNFITEAPMHLECFELTN